tara:strand:+ start:110 stop:322 length:213 start_codon:yes stop_codon:yes gene_type:complete
MSETQKTKTSTIKMEWNWRAHMASLIQFIERGNDDNKRFAYDELMKLADELDKIAPIKENHSNEKATEKN